MFLILLSLLAIVDSSECFPEALNAKRYLYEEITVADRKEPEDAGTASEFLNAGAETRRGIITGKIKDAATDNPLENVNVLVDGTPFGAATDKKGEFVIGDIEAGDHTLKISMVGYKEKTIQFEVVPDAIVVINITLDPTVLSSDGIVVTATRTEKRLGDVPATARVITHKEIESSPANTVDEILRRVAGIDLQRSQGFVGSSGAVSIRGVGSYRSAGDRTMILLDGVPINSMYTGQVAWNAIPKKEVDRIEILSGPASALYGSMAMGGVVNLITKNPAMGEKPVDIQIGCGGWSTREGSVKFTQARENWGVRINGQYLETDGYISTPEEDRDDYTTGSEVERYILNGNLNYRFLKNHSLIMKLLYSDSDRIKGREYYTSSTKDYKANLGWTWKGKRTDWKVSLYGNSSPGDEAQDTRSHDAINYFIHRDKDDAGIIAQVSLPVGESHTITAGSDYRWGKAGIENTAPDGSLESRGGGSKDLLSLFAQEEWKPGKRLGIVAGARADLWRSFDGYTYEPAISSEENHYEKRSDWAISPKIGLNFHLNDIVTLRSVLGSSFRTPNLYELYYASTRGQWDYLPNPNLEPENMYSVEVGIDIRFGDKFVTRTAAYGSEARNYIYSIATDEENGIKEKMNVGKVKIDGIEWEAEYKINRWFSVSGNYTYTHSVISQFTPDTSLENKELRYTPHHKGNLGISFSHPRFVKISVAGRYVGYRYNDDLNEEKVEDFFVVDVNLSKKLTDNMEVILDVENALDKTYEEYEDVIAPPLFIMGKLRVSF